MLIAYQNSSVEKSVAAESVFVRRLTEEPENFWRKIEKEKTPIFEEIEGDVENILCTFVFKGDEKTERVFVNLPPFSRISPNEFQMSQIKGTDIWFVSAKLPMESRFGYSFVVNCSFQNVNPESPKSEIEAFQNASRKDPLNPNFLRKNHSFIETPNVKPQKYLGKKSNIESGKIERFNFKSEFLENQRTVSIYTPPKFDASKKYPLLILLDEEIYLDEINAPTILDNLLAENLIPPMISVFVGNAEGMRMSELGGNLQFAEFINGEFLDWISKSYKISENPNELIIGGASFGGLTAVLTGLSYPETFGKILSQSGSFWRNWDSVTTKLFERDFPQQKIYLDAGLYEIEQKNDTNILETNRNLRDILQAKKIAVSYQEFKGGHGAVNWRGTLSAGLICLTKDLLKKQTLVGNPNLF